MGAFPAGCEIWGALLGALPVSINLLARSVRRFGGEKDTDFGPLRGSFAVFLPSKILRVKEP